MDRKVMDANRGLKFDIHTFGCKVNTYDTGLLQKRLSMAGLIGRGTESKVHILNTCAVTAEATKEAQRKIRRIKAKDPLAFIVVTGCAAQVDTDQFSSMSGVDLVVANSHKGDLESIIKKYLIGETKDRIYKSNIFKKLELEAGGGVEENHTRTFLKVQDGCNSFCTYCVIPFARGKSRSIPVDQLVAKVNSLHLSGVKEVVITGIHIGDYEDGNKKLEDLMEALLLGTRMPRFRISSLEPPEITERLLEIYQNPRMCPHFHMSIQSASDAVLLGMKRQYLAHDVESCLNEIDKKVSDVFIGMDVIVGFPGESDELFEETYNRLKSLPWSRIHVFPYSERPGTYAVRFKDQSVPPEVIKERARRLRELSHQRYSQAGLDQVGKSKSAIILKGGLKGITEDNWPIVLDEPALSGELIEVNLKGFEFNPNQRLNGLMRAEPQV